MKLIKKFSLVFMLFACLLSLVSCANLEKYASKINKAADKDDHITYAEVVKKLGKDNIIDATTEVFGFRGGVIICVKGCQSWDDVQAKLDAGKKVEGIYITILNSKATHAEYREITAADKK